jgi:hypothetical protein
VRLQVSAFLYWTLCCAVPRCLVEWDVVVLEGVCYRLLEGHRLPSACASLKAASPSCERVAETVRS